MCGAEQQEQEAQQRREGTEPEDTGSLGTWNYSRYQHCSLTVLDEQEVEVEVEVEIGYLFGAGGWMELIDDWVTANRMLRMREAVELVDSGIIVHCGSSGSSGSLA